MKYYDVPKAEYEKPERYYLEVIPDGDLGVEIYGDKAGLTYLRDCLMELLEAPEGFGYHVHIVTVNKAGESNVNDLLICYGWPEGEAGDLSVGGWEEKG